MTGRKVPTEGVSGLSLPPGTELVIIGPVPAAEVARARELQRTRAMTPGLLTDGEIGNEVRDAGTTPERREALLAEATERKKIRAATGLDARAGAVIDRRVTGRAMEARIAGTGTWTP